MNLLPLIVVLALVVAAAVALIIIGFRTTSEVDPLQERLSQYVGERELEVNLEQIEMSVPFSERVLVPLAQQLARFTSQFTPQETLEKTSHHLELAGDVGYLTPALLWLLRFIAMAFVGLALLIVLSATHQKTLLIIIGALGGAAAGFMLPQMWLMSKIKRRQTGIVKALPDALDLMSICVNAGLGFDQAMAQVYEKWDNELALAFGRVIQEIQLGKTRREALRAMAETMDVPDVTTFVGSIIQADQLGVSISKVLNIQADQMRIKRRQRAQEKAQQAPAKMMIPTAIFIFPSIWLVLLAPAAIQLYKTIILR
jgi:tight adherence protein C